MYRHWAGEQQQLPPLHFYLSMERRCTFVYPRHGQLTSSNIVGTCCKRAATWCSATLKRESLTPLKQFGSGGLAMHWGEAIGSFQFSWAKAPATTHSQSCPPLGLAWGGVPEWPSSGQGKLKAIHIIHHKVSMDHTLCGPLSRTCLPWVALPCA